MYLFYDADSDDNPAAAIDQKRTMSASTEESRSGECDLLCIFVVAIYSYTLCVLVSVQYNYVGSIYRIAGYFADQIFRN